MNTAMLFVLSLTTVAVFLGETLAMPPAQCSPGLLDEIPLRIRKVCAALFTIYDLSSAMESYIDDKVPLIRENMPLPGGGVKRQEVEHVFLRFGKRR